MRKHDANNILAILNNKTFMRAIDAIAKEHPHNFDVKLREFVGKAFALQWPKDFTKIAAVVDVINHFVDASDSKIKLVANKPLDDQTVAVLENRLIRHFNPLNQNEFINVIMPNVAQDIEEWEALPPAPNAKEEIAIEKAIVKSVKDIEKSVHDYINNGDFVAAKRYFNPNRLVASTQQTQFFKQLKINEIIKLIDIIASEVAKPKPLISSAEAQSIMKDTVNQLQDLRHIIAKGYDSENKSFRAKAVCGIVERAVAKIKASEAVMMQKIAIIKGPPQSYAIKAEKPKNSEIVENLSRKSNEHK